MNCQSRDRESEEDFESKLLRAAKNQNSEVLRSLLNTNSRENGVITKETAKLINNVNTCPFR